MHAKRSNGPSCTSCSLGQYCHVKILMIEDNIPVAQSLSHALEASDVTVTHVITAEDAALVADDTYDMVLSDYDLGPDEPTGNQVCVTLRPLMPAARFIIMSGLERNVPDFATFALKSSALLGTVLAAKAA